MTPSSQPALTLRCKMNAVAVDKLAQHPTLALAKKGAQISLAGYANRVKAGSFLRSGQYVDFEEHYNYGTATHNYGRVYCPNGAQGLRGEVRRHLFYGIYEDCDIENAQPAMLLQLMDKLQYDGQRRAIGSYCDNRADALTLVERATKCTRSEAKELYLSILFGSSVSRWCELHGDLCSTSRAHALAWQDEVRHFVAWFDAEHGEFVRSKDRRTDDELRAQHKSPMHRRLSLYLQEEERATMLCALQWLITYKDAEVGVFIHDGAFVHVPGGVSAVAEELSEHVLAETRYSLVFKAKSLEPTSTLDELMRQLTAEDPRSLVSPEFDPKTDKDKYFCAHFVAINKDKLLWDLSGEIWHYGDVSYAGSAGAGLWHCGMPPLQWWDDLFPDTPYSQSAGKINLMATMLKKAFPQLKQRVAWDVLPLHTVALQDCVYNMLTDEVSPFRPEHRLTRKIDLQYRPGVLTSLAFADEAAALQVDERLLYNGNTALCDAMEERWAYSALTAGNPFKRLFNLIGDGNNGKSAAGGRVLATVGEQYGTTLDAGYLTQRPDASKPNPFLKMALNCNLSLVEEPDREAKFNVAFLKELSGGSMIRTRDLHEKGSSTKTMTQNNTTLVVMSNFPFEVKGADKAFLQRIERIDMPSRFFKNEEDRLAALERIECIFERADKAASYHIGDPDFVARYRQPKMREVYFASLVAHYRAFTARGSLLEVPEEFSYGIDCEEEEEGLDIPSVYEETFEETGDPEHFLSVKDAVKAIMARRITVSAVALGKIMKSSAAKNKRIFPYFLYPPGTIHMQK